MNVLEARGKRAKLYERQQEILAVAEKERRNLTSAESEEWDRLEREFNDLSSLIQRGEKLDEQHRRSIEAQARGDAGAEVNERTVVLAPEQRVADFVALRAGEGPELDLRKFLAGIVSGQWENADAERRAMSEGTLSAGGHTVPLPLAAQVIDLARAKTRVFQAGAKTVPMERETLKIAKWTGDPTATWKVENAAGTGSDGVFDAITFNAKTLFAGPVLASVELIQDSLNLGDALANSFAQLLAVELDRVALFGTGTGEEPKGLRNITDVNQVSMGTNGAALTNHDKLLDAREFIRLDNHEPGEAFIMSPRTQRVISGFKDTTNQPLRRPDELSNARFLSSTNVSVTETQGTANNASSIYHGDWSQLLVGIRLGVVIKALEERYAENYQVGFIAALRADIQVEHPEAFARIIGIIP